MKFCWKHFELGECMFCAIKEYYASWGKMLDELNANLKKEIERRAKC